ncbi:MAG: serine/threonine protein kinase [Rhodospirillaceae bacterium]|nr:serine/threonine protein kinase [Rhodospirillaceae bacterium]
MADDGSSQNDQNEEETAAGDIVLDNRYHILVGSRLPDLDLGGAEAVTVRDDRNSSDALFARICPSDSLPRLELLNNFKHMMDAKMLRPLECGSVRWPGSRAARTAIIFHKPEHGAVLPLGAENINALHTEEITRCVLTPIIQTLGVLTQRSLTHRSIRADNIHWDGAGRNSVLLGDCISYPPAFMQPVVYETIESGMTPPISRGAGTVRDDFYSLGVTIVALATGKVPLSDKSDEEIIESKLKRGSYAALMDGARPPFGLRELLRGLLSDIAEERWGMDQLEQWMAGGLRSTVQEARSGAAERPFEYGGKEYSNLRALAHAFGDSWKKAGKAIADPSFEKWLSRITADGPMSERIDSILALRADVGKMGPAQVTQVCMFLDPCGPLRYNGLTTMPFSTGPALAHAFAKKDKDRVNLILESITGGLAIKWFNCQSTRDQILFEKDLKDMRRMQQLMRHTGPGYGIERCLYMLNPHLPCQSEFLQGQFVSDVRELLPILEKLIEKNGELPTIVDRHLTAFIASRIRANIDRLLFALEAAQGDAFMTKLGMLSLFAAVQSKHGPDELPHLTAWLARELEPAVDRYQGKSMRDQMRKKLKALSGGGNLVDLHACLNSENALKKDEVAKKKAMREFASAAREIGALESKEFHDSVQRLGWRIASGISTSVSFATAVIVVFS